MKKPKCTCRIIRTGLRSQDIEQCALCAAAPMLLAALKAIRDYEPNEVAKDDFAYDRMVENYRDAAREGIKAAS